MPSKDDQLRPRLEAAAKKLHQAGEPDLAEAVETILAPNGWGRLRRTDPTTSEGERNVPIWMPKAWRQQIKDAAEAEGVSLSAVVDEGFGKYLDGSFEPPAPTRGRYPSGAEMGNLNVRPSGELRARVEAGSMPVSHVAASYLFARYQVGPYAPDKASTA
jgi:hypothetical protein